MIGEIDGERGENSVLVTFLMNRTTEVRKR